ncbi:MAG: fumarylacetoacetate hydrolase family protein [Vulcanimicrobiaceae bacterium]
MHAGVTEAVFEDTLAALRTASISPRPTEIIEGLTEIQAYALAARLRERRVADGEVLAGWKIGFTNPVVRSQYHASGPIFSAMYQTTVGRERTVALEGLVAPRLEPEVVFTLRDGEIATIALGFEIVQSHSPGWQPAWLDTIVDFGLHGRLIVGDERPYDPHDAELLANCDAALSRNGDVNLRGNGRDVHGSPLLAFAWLRERLADEGVALDPAAIVTTGSLTGVPALVRGDRWTIDVPALRLAPLTIAIG